MTDPAKPDTAPLRQHTPNHHWGISMSTEYRNRHSPDTALEHTQGIPDHARESLAELVEHPNDRPSVEPLAQLAIAIHQSVSDYRISHHTEFRDHPLQYLAQQQVFDATADIHDHYRRHGDQYPLHEREHWIRIIQHSQLAMDNHDDPTLAEFLDVLQNHDMDYPDPSEAWSPHDTLIVADDDTLDALTGAYPELQDFPCASDDVTISDIRNRHIVGNIPADLEHHAASVTRYSVQANLKDPSEWTWEDYANPNPRTAELVQYRSEAHVYNIHHLDPSQVTYVTDDVQLALHWRRHNITDPAAHTVVVATDRDTAEVWQEAGFFDANASLMLVDPNVDPSRWLNDVPQEATVIYADIPPAAEDLLVHAKHVVGEPPAHLKHLASSTTAWPHDPYTGIYGQPVTTETKLISRGSAPPPSRTY